MVIPSLRQLINPRPVVLKVPSYFLFFSSLDNLSRFLPSYTGHQPTFFLSSKNALLPQHLPRRCSCIRNSDLCSSPRRCRPRLWRSPCPRCVGGFPPCQERRVSLRRLQYMPRTRFGNHCRDQSVYYSTGIFSKLNIFTDAAVKINDHAKVLSCLNDIVAEIQIVIDVLNGGVVDVGVSVDVFASLVCGLIQVRHCFFFYF